MIAVKKTVLTVLVFSILAVFVYEYGAVRIGVDSPLIPVSSGARMLRVLDHGSPGYRAVVAASLAMGFGLFGVAGLQVVLATCAAMRIEGVGRSLGGTAGGLTALALFVLNPDQLRWHAYLLPDSLYASALILTIAAAASAWSLPTPGRLVVALVSAIGAGTLNATGYLLIPIIVAFWSMRGRALHESGWFGRAMTMASLTCILLMLPLVRETTLNGTKSHERPDRGIVVRDLEESCVPMPVTTGRASSGAISGIMYLVAHPGASVHLAALRVVAALTHLRPYYSPRHNLAVLSLLIPVYTLAVLGLIAARRQPLALLVTAVVMVHLVVIALTHTDWDGRSLLVVLPLIGVLAGSGLARVRWSSTWMLALGVSAVLVTIVLPVFLTGLAFRFRVDDPAASDALVLLLGGGPDRPQMAARLYRRGLGSVILLGGDSDLAFNRDTLISEGVPAGAICSLGTTIGTREEAWRVGDYARNHPLIRRITVVTTAFHTARARWIFRRALLDTGVEVRTAASEDARFDETNWYASVDGFRAYSQEVLKMGYAYMANDR